MAHLHSLGIIHRDFRAANILISDVATMAVVVADFGVSHRLLAYEQVNHYVAVFYGTNMVSSSHSLLQVLVLLLFFKVIESLGFLLIVCDCYRRPLGRLLRL